MRRMNGFLRLLCEGWKPEGRETCAARFTTARSAQPTRHHGTRSTEVDRRGYNHPAKSP
jgi:hypothetical protein